jgi:hypothetical protein
MRVHSGQWHAIMSDAKNCKEWVGVPGCEVVCDGNGLCVEGLSFHRAIVGRRAVHKLCSASDEYTV